jgi:hypothetical protein
MAKIRAGEPVKCCALGHFMPFFVHVSVTLLLQLFASPLD